MPLKLRLSVGALCFAAVTLAQQPYSWKDNPPPVEVFAPVLQKVWAASSEKEPFDSIKGAFDPGQNNWQTNVVLPGASNSDCRIAKASGPYKFQYTCQVKEAVRFDAKAAGPSQTYLNLVNLVKGSRSDWNIEPSENSTAVMVRFTIKTKKPINEDAHISISDLPSIHVVYIMVSPPLTLSDVLKQIEAPPTSSGIDSEIATVLGSGRYSSLPTPQASDNGTSGRTTLAITNGTQYSLKILASGPTEGQYTISPGATQEIEVSPGSYKIVGRVSASNVLPFYGTQTYAAGSKYSYRFFVK